MIATVKPARTDKRRSKPKKARLPFWDTAWGAKAYADALDALVFMSVTDTKGRIIYVNENFLKATKYTREELIGQDHRILNSGHHPAAFFDDMYRTIRAGKPWRAPIKNKAKDGSYYWVDALIAPLKNGEGRRIGFVSVRFDITNAVNLHVEVAERTRLLQGVLENFPGGISVYNHEERMIVCNEKQKALLGFPPELFANGPPALEDIYRFNAQRGEYGEGDIEDHVKSRLKFTPSVVPRVYDRQRPNGTCLEVRTSPMTGGGFVATYIDVTERKRDQAIIAKLAHHDPLTGLPNRLLFQDRIEMGLGRVDRGETMALLYLDLDRFKPVNDTLGHPAGDALLKAVAGRLKSATRAMDTVARLGGDEFAILIMGPKSAADVESIARRIIKTVSQPYEIGKHSISIGTSIGIAMAPNDGRCPDKLLKNADLALYRSKTEGRGSHSFFEPKMHEKMQTVRIIESGLRDALKNNGFELHYQPIINIADRRVVSCEALIRWSHPKRGLVSAADFIPVAEECGLIGQIGSWVLQEGCREARKWPEDVSISINVSPAQFRGHDLEPAVMKALGGLPPSRLILEITESLLMQNSEATLRTLERLRAIGVRFALDDFGTGFSSLSYLQSFPFDKIKIDRSFVSATSNWERSSTLRHAIAQLGHSLGMITVAEGVETEDQLAHVASEGCVEAQGYLISKAVPDVEITSFFKQRT